jgi:YD repeat-containing protein
VLRYQYDKTGRVTTVDGPEELQLEYRYDANRRLISVTNARKVRLNYRYSDTSALLATADQFGNELNLNNATARVLAQPSAPASTAARPVWFGRCQFASAAFSRHAWSAISSTTGSLSAWWGHVF